MGLIRNKKNFVLVWKINEFRLKYGTKLRNLVRRNWDFTKIC